MKELSPRSRVRLDNVACAYCHKPFNAEIRPEEEHVIGKNFVPKGSLAAQWNLIVNACGSCNDEKCELENDLSAITMRQGFSGRFVPDARLLDEARRKETAKSKRTGKAVKESAEEVAIRGEMMPGVRFFANFISGPQMDHERVYRLAYFHVAAFFYWITFDNERRQGHPIPCMFGPVAGVARPDWGNPQMLGFQELIASWPHRVHAVGADSYFKIVIRRAPEEQLLWAWALEWNRSFRVAGFMGDGDAAQAAFDRLPPLRKMPLERGVDPNKGPFETWGREEVSVADKDDQLFDPPAVP